MNQNILRFVLGSLLFALCTSAHAQQPGKIFRIGYLNSGSFSGNAHLLEAFRQRLRELEWIEGKNISFEYRFADGKGSDRVKELADELVRLKVDVIVASATTGSLAAQAATSTIPTVMTSGGDPVGAGLVKSLARPGGNITGVSTLSPELITKRLALLKDVVPKLRRLGILIVGERKDVGPARQIKELEPAAQSMRVSLLYLECKGEKDLEKAFESVTRERIDALMPTSGPPALTERKRIAELAVKYRIPAAYPSDEFVKAGGLMSYGVDDSDQYRRAATYVDKILKGAKPADLPVEQPKKFEFVINLNAAKQIGLTIPPNVLARADKVIK